MCDIMQCKVSCFAVLYAFYAIHIYNPMGYIILSCRTCASFYHLFICSKHEKLFAPKSCWDNGWTITKYHMH